MSASHLSSAFALALLVTGLDVLEAQDEELPLSMGDRVPDFSLPDLEGNTFTLDLRTRERPTILLFWCPNCPVVREQRDRLLALFDLYKDKVHFVAIASNLGDDASSLREALENDPLPFPVLRDEGNRVADLCGARTTPQYLLVGTDRALRYDGNLVSRTLGEPTLVPALDAVLGGREVPPTPTLLTRPYGCAIRRNKDD